jgi:Fe-S-cluster containining protein
MLELKTKRMLPIEEQLENVVYEQRNTTNQKNDKFYLPILYINDPSQWESKKLSERKHLTDEEAQKACLGNCCGIKGLKAGCCHLDSSDLEHVLGPVSESWIKETLKWFSSKKMYLKREDLVIDFSEGKVIGETFFGGHKVFQSKDSYPILRFQVSGPRFVCKFLNPENGRCSIYRIRPEMCKNYYCEYIKSNFLLRTPEHPNTWIKVR